MWTVLFFLAVFCVAYFAVDILGFAYINRKFRISVPKLDKISAIILGVCLAVGSVVLYLFKPFYPPHYLVVGILLVSGVLYLACTQQKKRRNLFLFLCCLAGVFGLMMPYPANALAYWIVGILLSILWYGAWRLFIYFEPFPMMSYTISTAWTLALLLVAILPAVPIMYGVLIGLFGISLFALARKRLVFGLDTLGKPLAGITGFIWAGVWTYIVLKGDIMTMFVAYSYYLMEGGILLYQSLMGQKKSPIFVRAYLVENQSNKVLSSVFGNVFLLGLFGILISLSKLQGQFLLQLILMVVICIHIFTQLNNVIHPTGSWKEVFSDLKKGLSALPNTTKALLTKKPKKSINKTQKKTVKKKVKRKK